MDRIADRLSSSRFWAFVVAGVVAFAIVIVVGAVTAGAEFAVPTAILAVVVLVAAVGGRVIHARQAHGGRAAGSREHATFEYPMESERPLGDTPEAHDEITPHDIPQYNAEARHAAEHETGGDMGATIRGHEQGGAQGEGGPDEGSSERVSDDEKRSADLGRDSARMQRPSHSGRTTS